MEEFGLREDVPEGGCVVEVVEDFLEYGGENTELWLHDLYVVVRANPGRENSSTLVLQKDGALWVTNSVFQSNDDIGRGIDVNSNDGGAPQLFVSGEGLVKCCLHCCMTLQCLCCSIPVIGCSAVADLETYHTCLSFISRFRRCGPCV